MYDELIQLLGNPPAGYEWLVYFVCCILFIFVFANALRLIGSILSGGR